MFDMLQLVLFVQANRSIHPGYDKLKHIEHQKVIQCFNELHS